MSRSTEPRLVKRLALRAAVALCLLPWLSFAAEPRYGLGRLATPQEIAGWDIDVRPDGQGLPKGSGSVARGQELYDAQCASCHGTFGEDNQYMAIAGGVQRGDVERGRAASLSTDPPIRTVGTKLNHATTLWDYIHRAMPFARSKTLTPDEVYALTAYVLHLNDILPADATLDEKSLLAVRMPNRNGFTTEHGFMKKTGRPDVRNTACMSNCAAHVTVTSELPVHARDSHGDLSEQVRTFAPIRGVRLGEAPAKPSGASAPSPGYELAKRAACIACHGLDHKVVGPGFREISSKYKGEGDAESRLIAKLKAGGSGVWGPIPMPAQAHLSDEDMKTLIQWILAGSPTQ
ncbi:MAG TPA: c-type cytochrome [Archangium sp.]|jgi:cytochrome c|uniref:c-type cytochrome n=1 Tax=Archangium sp. TaxID=1872627 RepID=UPI002EDB3F1F